MSFRVQSPSTTIISLWWSSHRLGLWYDMLRNANLLSVCHPGVNAYEYGVGSCLKVDILTLTSPGLSYASAQRTPSPESQVVNTRVMGSRPAFAVHVVSCILVDRRVAAAVMRTDS